MGQAVKRTNTPWQRKRYYTLCPAVERIIREIPPYIGLTGDALRATVEKCVKAQIAHNWRAGRKA